MFIAQFFTFAFLLAFLTSMMLLGWPAVVVMVIIISTFIAKFLSEIINTINK